MLSFDVTDRSIRVIRGTDVGGRVKIQSSTTIDIPEGLVQNGYINDILQMATVVNNGLKQKKMNDKDAIVSISSNRIQFKELNVPQAKKSAQFKTMVQNMMQQTMTVTSDQCISYSVAGNFKDGEKELTKVLATACPRDIVDCYKKLFSMLGISLKSVMVSCNCISKVVTADKKASEIMPLLLVQIDPHFININLFENGRLSFTRFTSIYEDDYDDKSDYMFQAANDNIFRMIQFQKARRGQEIKNVIFYGDTSEFIRLTNSLEQMDIKAQLLKVPSNLSGYENLEFSLFANAIGAMFYSKPDKKKKDNDSVNLLDTDVGTTNQVQVSGGKVGMMVLGAFAATALVVGAAFGVVKLMDYNVLQQIAQKEEYIQSKQDPLAEIDRKNGIISKLNQYEASVMAVKDTFDALPIYNSEVYITVMAEILKADENIEGVEHSYADGLMNFTIPTKKLDIPSTIVQNIVELDMFDNVDYQGYSSGGEGENTGSKTDTVVEILDPETGEVIGEEVIPAKDEGLSFELSMQIRSPKGENSDNVEGGEE